MKKIALPLIVMMIVSIAVVYSQEPQKVEANSLLERRIKICLNRISDKALACYQSALSENPELAGSLKLKVTVDTSGAAQSIEIVKDTLDNKKTNACIVKLFEEKTWPQNGEPVYFEYTYNFMSSPEE